MKKLLGLFILIIMILSFGEGLMVRSQVSVNQDDINASLIVSNDSSQPQAVKAFSVEELDNYIYKYHQGYSPIYFDKDKYDESFFEDKFLYFSFVTTTGSSPLLRITSVSETKDFIEVEITKSALPTSPDMASWILVLEIDRALSDKEILIKKVQQNIKSVDVANNNIAVELTLPKLNNEVLIVAVYDSNGKILSFSRNSESTETPKVYDISVAVHPTDAKKIKVMWWDGLNTMQPLCLEKTLEKDNNDWIPTD